MKGVNLGGWLVIEKWITPSLFKGMDASNEFELSKIKEGRERIKKHHHEFITEEDLKWLKKEGIEILRVPIGYWILGSDKRYVASSDRLDWLVHASLSYGFKLLLDLHAAPGAQNRAAHSGSGNLVINKHSTKWLNDSEAQEQTIAVLEKIARKYRDFPHIWGIEMLNEPSPDLFGLKLARFYRKAYRRVTGVARPGTHIVFSDAYAPFRLTNCLWLIEQPDFPVVMDCHVYQVFGKRNKNKPFESHIKHLEWVRLLLRFLRLQQPIIVGEWSTMLQSRVSAVDVKRYATSQTDVFSLALAHFYWSYKTEGEGRWNYRDMINKDMVE